MMAYVGSESSRDNFSKFNIQPKPKTKPLKKKKTNISL